MAVRTMTANDIEEIRKLDSLVFSAHRKDIRTAENILANLRLNPEGCFVFEENGIIGYIFSHIWGDLAWIGTFGIAPGHQGKGIGKKLLTAELHYLNNRGSSIIGLETFSDSPYNIGLYLQSGFIPITPTLVFKKLLDQEASSARTDSNAAVDFELVSRLSRNVLKGLDYANEAQSAVKDGWGKVLFCGTNPPLGFAVLRLIPALAGYPKDSATIQAMVLEADSEDLLGDSLRTIEAYTAANGFKDLAIPVNSINDTVVHYLLKQGYKLQQNFTRMVYQGKYQDLRGVDLSRWAM